MKRIAAVLAALMLAGCITSLHPLYTEDDLVFEPELLGLWKPKEREETWEFKQRGQKAYGLTYTDEEGRPGEFEARLVKLGEHLFLDLFPKEPKLKTNDFYLFHLLPAHSFMKVSALEPELELVMLDPEWVEKLVEKDPKAMKYEVVEHRLVLTASTAELQKFILTHADNEKAWADFVELGRAKVEEAPASPEEP